MESLFLDVRSARFPLRVLFILASGMWLNLFASKAFGASPLGLWYAEGGAAEVQVFRCADALCG
jgi:hypothetical protein